MSIDLSKSEKRVYSQNGEDGITEKLINMLYTDTTPKFYIEFGVGDGSQCNTRILREKYGWSGLLMDCDFENKGINLNKEFITKENVVQLFEKYKVSKHVNLLSVDVDFNDFYCLREILKNYTFDIIICEYNASHPPNADKVIIYDKNRRWDYTNYFGASLLAYTKLCNKFNYTLVYCENKGVNCFFVNNNLIKGEINFLHCNDVEFLYKPPKYGVNPNGGHKNDNKNRQYITFDQAYINN